MGTQECQKVPGTEPSQPLNFGFDDDIGNYYLRTGDHLLYRYEVLSILGSGSFGQCAKCFDHKS